MKFQDPVNNFVCTTKFEVQILTGQQTANKYKYQRNHRWYITGGS